MSGIITVQECHEALALSLWFFCHMNCDCDVSCSISDKRSLKGSCVARTKQRSFDWGHIFQSVHRLFVLTLIWNRSIDCLKTRILTWRLSLMLPLRIPTSVRSGQLFKRIFIEPNQKQSHEIRSLCSWRMTRFRLWERFSLHFHFLSMTVAQTGTLRENNGINKGDL
jgi:hypothetical protein